METSGGDIKQLKLGMSADGLTCMLLFVDDEQRTMKCTVTFPEFAAFISNLSNAAQEMARRQALTDKHASLSNVMNVASGAFRLDAADGSVMGALVSDSGDVVGVRMQPDVACHLTRAILLAAPAAGRS
jgi:hypothetical protein